MMSYSECASQAVDIALGNDYTNVGTIEEFVWDSLVEYAIDNDERLCNEDGELVENHMLLIEDHKHPVGKDIQEAYENVDIQDILDECNYFRSCGGWEGYYGVSRYD